MSIWAGTNGKMDEVPVEDILRFEQEMLDYLKRNTSVLDDLRNSGKLEDETLQAMESGIDEFSKTFQKSDGKPLLSVGTEEFDATNAEDVQQEQIVRGKRR